MRNILEDNTVGSMVKESLDSVVSSGIHVVDIFILMINSVVSLIATLNNMISPFATFVTAISTSISALVVLWWHLTKPKLYIKGFISSNPPADKSHTLYFARIGITRFRRGIEVKYKGPKIKFDGIAIWNDKPYNLDWPREQGFLEEGKLHLLRKGRGYEFNLSSADYKQYLKEGTVNNALSQAFSDKGISLTENAYILGIDERNWRIINGEQLYIIKGTDADLEIYREVNEDKEIFLNYSNGQLPIRPMEHIRIKVIPNDPKDKDIGGIDELWKVGDIIKKSVEWDYNRI